MYRDSDAGSGCAGPNEHHCYNHRMFSQRNQNVLNSPCIASAIEICRRRRAAGVLPDPLGFAEYGTESANSVVPNNIRTEIEMITRPKPAGGSRVEVVPDFITSIRLQCVADQVPDRKQPQPYDYWWETVPLWIQHALVEGMTVIVADIDNYFPAISESQIKQAMMRLGLEHESVDMGLSAIRAINEHPDENGRKRTGLPIADEELIWLIADDVLRPVDDRLANEPVVVRHTRWIDDFFVAVNPDNVDLAMLILSEVLEEEGLRLNQHKTRILDTLVGFERHAMTSEHRLVSNLAMIASKVPLSASQQSAFERLMDTERSLTIDHVRLWKRIYSLAERLRCTALVPEAISDLRRYPTAEKQISSYLCALNWPCGTAVQAVERVANAPTDSQAIVLLRALLGTQESLSRTALSTLRKVSESTANQMHPYSIALIHACLMMGEAKTEWPKLLQQIVSLTRNTRSPFARRVAFELLWLMPDHRNLFSVAIKGDSSPTVWGLASLPAIDRTKTGSAANVAQEWEWRCDPSWGRLGSEVNRTWMRERI